MLSGKRLLIVEDVFLIALDIQRTLEGANALQTVFARDFKQAATLGDALEGFDLAIVNPPIAGSPDMQIAARLMRAGVPLVVCTAASTDLSATPLAGAEVVVKPFSDEQMVAACLKALAKNRH